MHFLSILRPTPHVGASVVRRCRSSTDREFFGQSMHEEEPLCLMVKCSLQYYGFEHEHDWGMGCGVEPSMHCKQWHYK